jgi:branched-chain amino acid transport system ATP-binding protein
MSAATATPALSIEHVSVHFGGLAAVADMSFVVSEGELVSLIGPNGAGKTTAFNVITGFLKPTQGEVRYRGVALTRLKSHEVANLGLVRTFQKTSVFGNNTVFENVLIGLHRHGKASIWGTLLALPRVRDEETMLREEAWEILRFVGLDGRANELGGALPYGEQRLLEVAIALAARPSMLLLDEPVSGMNPSETASFIALLGKIRARDITVLLVEHDMHLVMNVSDRIVVLNYGRIIAEGPPQAIQQNPEVIRAYLGHGVRKRSARA